MRFDSIGMFWQDVLDPTKGRAAVARAMPPIPDTGWTTPKDFPNLSAAEYLTIDTEGKDPELTTHGPGWARGKSHIVGVSVGTPEGYSWYFPMRHEIEPEYNMDPEKVLAWLRDTLGNPKQAKLGANLLYDVGVLRCEGVTVAGELVDVQFAEALLDERAEVNLDVLGIKYAGVGKESNLLYDWCSRFYGGKANGTQRANIYRAPPRLVGPYAQGDVDLPTRVIREQYPLLAKEGLLDLFAMECALIPLLVEMRLEGVSIDIPKAEALRDKIVEDVKGLKKKLRDLAGFEVETNAAQSIAKAFDKFGYPYSRTEPSKSHPKGQPSFTKEFLAKAKNPIAQGVYEIRKLEKLQTVFLESYLLESHVNGKVFCSFHPLREDEGGTRSGRFSSSHPNLQNIPVRDDIWGPLIRGLFIPDPGHVAWRKYDYSQIEYRFLIHYAVGRGAEEARQHFRDRPDTDYHEWALDLIAPKAGWDISSKELRKKWRRPVKNINFGLIYGMGEEKLAEDLGLSLAEAKRVFAAYHSGVPFAKPTIETCSREAQDTGAVTTILRRKSRFDLWEPDTRRRDWTMVPLEFSQAIRRYGSIKRAYTYRALNRRLQGSAADMMKMAMLQCWQQGIFTATGIPRLTVHDELDFSDPGGRDEAFLEMKRILETAIPLKIPVRADGDIGPDWGHGAAIQ